jgi:hypothetical protein
MEKETRKPTMYTAPVFLGMAFLLFGIAIIEKLLNLMNMSIPVVDVFPLQILTWAITLLIFEIALTLRQLLETRL